MKNFPAFKFASLVACLAAFGLAGCATDSGSRASASSGTTASASSASQVSGPAVDHAYRYKATDGRTIEIGKCFASEGGVTFKNPHLEKCWLAEGFTFSGFDTLYIAPTLSTAKYQTDEENPHRIAQAEIQKALARIMIPTGIFNSVVTDEASIKPGARVLRLENTITEYAKGGGGARYWAGMFGAGQPMFRLQGRLSEGDKALFLFQARRSGVSARARMSGGLLTDTEIQYDDIQSFVLDWNDFVSAIAGKYVAQK